MLIVKLGLGHGLASALAFQSKKCLSRRKHRRKQRALEPQLAPGHSHFDEEDEDSAPDSTQSPAQQSNLIQSKLN